MQMFGGGQSLVISDQIVSDGSWHNATVTASGMYNYTNMAENTLTFGKIAFCDFKPLGKSHVL